MRRPGTLIALVALCLSARAFAAPDPQVAAAVAQLKAKQFAEAATTLRPLVKANPSNPKLLQLFCLALFKSGNTKASGAVAKKLLAVEPGNATAQKVLAALEKAAPAAAMPPPPPAEPASPPPPPPPPTPEMCEVTVGDKKFKTITEALLAAPAGAEVKVKPGVYRETVQLRQDVTLVGDGDMARILVEAPTGAAVEVRKGHKFKEGAIKGLTLKGQRGVLFVETGKLSVQRCDLSAPDTGIEVREPKTELSMDDCTVHGMKGNAFYVGRDTVVTFSGCRIQDMKGRPIVGGVDKGSRFTMTRCVFQLEDSDGLRLSEGSTTAIQDSTFENAKLEVNGALDVKKTTFKGKTIQLQVDKGSKVTVEAGSFSGSESNAVHAGRGAELTVVRSSFRDMTKERESAVRCEKDAKVKFEDCEFINVWEVGSIWGSAVETVFKNCKIHECVRGFYVENAILLLDGCELYDNKGTGVGVLADGAVTMRGCTLRGFGKSGIYAHKKAKKLTVEKCTLTGNTDMWYIEPGAPVEKKDNVE